MSRVIIIGGHGKVALLAAPLLVADGHAVTSVVRDPDQVADIEETGATAAVLDVENSSTEQIADLVRGNDVLVWSAGAGGGSPERTFAVDRDAAIRSMEAAAQAGVGRYVMVSYFGAGPTTASLRTTRSTPTPRPRRPPTSTCRAPTWRGRSCARAR